MFSNVTFNGCCLHVFQPEKHPQMLFLVVVGRKANETIKIRVGKKGQM